MREEPSKEEVRKEEERAPVARVVEQEPDAPKKEAIGAGNKKSGGKDELNMPGKAERRKGGAHVPASSTCRCSGF